ncbi:exopolysaccharide transport family protein [Pelagicoccus albus]|uniref:Polysaccharide chain length determinant N-terminal domain-containing protein n=1 Tax=Pelagicoccus albus TaxID=415222 RepID=A0A7X1B9U4_9BACT|nr:Wzz/FepE/Etk N-terminal domain-containing protein [Pelagicoccus albus]MBC2608236.1 hypothetical protein [Pelagicoccus albus]
MNNTTNQAAPSGLSLSPSDIYFILFRHKFKIIFFIILGLAAGAAAYKYIPNQYKSSAQLLIRYVTEKRDVVDENGSTVTAAIGGRGSEHIKMTELAILTSLDLAKDVANTLYETTPQPELAEMDAEAAKQTLTGQVAQGMEANFGNQSNIIMLSYGSESPDQVQAILQTIIDTYLKRHYEIHRAEGTFDEYLTVKTDELRANLLQTEELIIKTKQKAGIVSIEQSRNSINSEISRIQNNIFETQTNLAENQALQERLQKEAGTAPAAPQADEEEVVDVQENATLAQAIRDYEARSTRLEIFREQQRNLITRFAPGSTRIKAIEKKIEELEGELTQLLKDHPDLALRGAVTAGKETDEDLPYEIRISTAKANSIALQERLNILQTHLKSLYTESTRIDEVELTLNQLERRREMEANQYNTFLASLRQNQLDEEISSGRVNNITLLQQPTPPSKDSTLKMQIAGGTAGGIAILGLLWAFLKELLLDKSIKRPQEVQKATGLPLFLTIPDSKGKEFRKLTKRSNSVQRQLIGRGKVTKGADYAPKSTALKAAAKSKPDEYAVAKGNAQISPWEPQHVLHNYFEALRDRVIGYFESRNLQHNPKLIGLTGLGEQPGVSTIASGLAGSLSKTEGGNVLLVDMTLGQESAKQFYKGEEVSSLDEALESKDKAKLGENLYVVAEGTNGYKLPSILPSRFNSIVPKLKASDFDYIIFDMPAVSPISATPRLASFMDVVLMVVESEQTDSAVAKQATELLGDSKAHLGVVLNKTKSYVPNQLEQDFLGLK